MEDIEAHTNKKTAAVLSRKPNLPVTLMFDDISYKIKINQTRFILSKPKWEEKTILKGISGMVRSGEMLVMLGPSGSGKTTLLTALGGRRLHGRLDGHIAYNDKPFSNSMKRMIGFVTQDDILVPHLTVTETLVYTALLRLPNSYSKQEKVELAEAVISKLDLSKCKNSMIGSHILRGVSGGERKRVSIAQEMLVNPRLLLLDEPTSGLDSTTAQKIVSMTWEFASGGKAAVIMTIHQPSSRLFYMFDKILLLLEGNLVYFGKGSEVMDYFSTIGYSPSMPMNPSDFLLDLANGVSRNDPEEIPVMVKKKLVSSYRSKIAEKLELEIQESNQHWLVNESDEDNSFEDWPTTWWQQFCVLLSRGIKERRHESFSGLRIGQVLGISFFCGLLWWKSDDSHLQDKIGILYSTTSFWSFFTMHKAITTFPKERKILEKERSSGVYKLSSYFMSRTTTDLPMELALPTIFTIIVYWMTGLKPNASNFFYTLLTILLSVLVFQGFGLAIGALVLDQAAATTLGSVYTLTSLLISGYFLQNVPQCIAWFKYLSTPHYMYKLLLISQYQPHDTYPCPNSQELCKIGEFPPIKQVGLDGKAATVAALMVMLIGYRLLAYIALMRIGVAKRN